MALAIAENCLQEGVCDSCEQGSVPGGVKQILSTGLSDKVRLDLELDIVS